MLEIDFDDKVMTARLTGELDHHTSAVIRKKLDAQTEQLRPELLRLDYSGVQFMDSSGIGLIMGRYRQMSLLGGRLCVINIPEHLQTLFRLSGISALGVIE